MADRILRTHLWLTSTHQARALGGCLYAAAVGDSRFLVHERINKTQGAVPPFLGRAVAAVPEAALLE